MKRLFTILLLLAASVSFGQVKFGVKIGPTFSKYTTENGLFKEYYKYKQGMYVGGFANIPIQKNFNVQADLLFSRTGAIIDYDERPNNFKITVDDYAIAVPVAIQYNFFGFYAEVGGQVKFGLDRKYEYENYDPQNFSDDNNDEDVTYGVLFGIGYSISPSFNLEGRYFIELETDENKQVSRVFSIGFAYLF